MVIYNISASPDFSSVLDLTGVVDTRRTSIEMNGCSTAFSSAEDTASFTIRNIESPLRSNAITMLLDAYENGTDLYGRIMDNGRYLFSGMVDLGGISLTSTSLAGPVTVKLVDLGRKYLDVAPKRNIVIENVKISTVVSTLLGYAGCTVGTISIANDDDATLPCFVVDRDGNETYRNILDRLLLETGLYYLWFDSQGRCNVSPVTLSADSGIVPNYRISSGLQTTGSKILESKGLRVQWSTAAVKADQIIYVDNISKNLSEDGRSVIGTEILEDSYYPVDGDVDPIYQEYSVDFLDRPYMSGASRKKNTDLSLLMARDVTVYLQFTDELGRSLDTDDCVEYPSSPFTEEPVNPIMYAKKAFILMRALQDCYILHFQLKGTIRYRDVSYISSIGDTSSDPIDYTSEYIFSKAQAEKFAQRYWQMKQMSRLVHKWTDLDDLAIGSIVQIAHRDTAVSQYAYIVSRTSSFVGGVWQYEYTAVSIGSWNAGTVATRGSSLEKGRQGDVTIQYAWSSSSTTPPVDGWTAQPTARTDAEPYQWMRTSTDDGLTWAYSCITGADGLTVQYEYQYGDSATTPPTGQWYTADEFPYVFETYNIVWGSSTCLYNGDNMVMAADAVRGTYLWQRISFDGGTTWTYIRLTGEAGADAKYFGVACDTSTFTQNLRSSGSDSVALRLDTSGYASVTGIQWYRKYASNDAYAIIAGATSDTYTETIAHINSWSKIYYKVVATCDGTSLSTEFSISAVSKTEYDKYWGELDALPTGDIYVEGDYFIARTDFTGTDGKNYLLGIPYEYDGDDWYHELDITDADNMTKGMTVLGGALNSGIAIPSTASLWGFFQNLVSQNAVIRNLLTRNVTVGDGDGTPGSGFRFRAHSYDSNGNKLATPLFDVYYGDTLVFQINASTGQVYMVNASISGDFISTGFATSKASDNIQTFSFAAIDLDLYFDRWLWFKNICATLYNSSTYEEEVTQTLVDTFAAAHGISSSLVYPQVSSSNQLERLDGVSGTYKGVAYTSIAGRDGRSITNNMDAIVYNGCLYIFMILDGSSSPEKPELVSNVSSVVLEGTTVAPSDYILGYGMTSAALNNIASTYSIPTGNTMKVTSGTVSLNGTALNISTTNVYVLLNSSMLQIYNVDSNNNVLNNETFTDGSFYSANSFALSNVQVQASLDGIKTMHVVPYSDSTYDVGTSTNRYYNVYADNLYGTAQGSSARATKTKIRFFTGDALSLINRTSIVKFQYRNDQGKERCCDHIGFIADDTAEELATPFHDVMDYGSCIGVLMKAIQELTVEIERLKGENK